MSKVTTTVAFLLTLVFLGASIWMLYAFALSGDHAWDHAVIVYNALTSVGFTAVGVLLGTKVQQVHVDKANADAGAAKQDAASKSSAIRSALQHLDDPTHARDEAGGGSVTARAVLIQALQS